MKTTKDKEFAIRLIGAIKEVIDNDESDYNISLEELQEGDNCTDFFHALGNLMPMYFFNKMTGQDKKILDFNHDMNHLIIQKQLEEALGLKDDREKQNAKIKNALIGLVELKIYKEENGEDDHYKECKPHKWSNAIDVLKEFIDNND